MQTTRYFIQITQTRRQPNLTRHLPLIQFCDRLDVSSKQRHRPRAFRLSLLRVQEHFNLTLGVLYSQTALKTLYGASERRQQLTTPRYLHQLARIIDHSKRRYRRAHHPNKILSTAKFLQSSMVRQRCRREPGQNNDQPARTTSRDIYHCSLEPRQESVAQVPHCAEVS